MLPSKTALGISMATNKDFKVIVTKISVTLLTTWCPQSKSFRAGGWNEKQYRSWLILVRTCAEGDYMPLRKGAKLISTPTPTPALTKMGHLIVNWHY